MRILNKIVCFAVLLLAKNTDAQKMLPNTLIGKKEIEVNVSFLGSNYSEMGLGEVVYRKPVSPALKIGIGTKVFWGDLNNPDYKRFNIYPALFLDAIYFIGKTKRQKWGITLQPGYEFYKTTIDDYSGIDATGFYTFTNSTIKGGFYNMTGITHRAILSSRVQLVTNGFFSVQRTVQKGLYTNSTESRIITSKRNNFGGGIKIGIVLDISKRVKR